MSAEVSVATLKCYRCNKQGHIARNCGQRTSNVGGNEVVKTRETHKIWKRSERLSWQPKAEIAPRGCEDDKKKPAGSRHAVVIDVKDSVTRGW
jgi:hypothetical protein